MISNRLCRSSILCSDEKLVYKMERIEVRTTRLCVMCVNSRFTVLLVEQGMKGLQVSIDLFGVEILSGKKRAIYLARSFRWTSFGGRFNNLIGAFSQPWNTSRTCDVISCWHRGGGGGGGLTISGR